MHPSPPAAIDPTNPAVNPEYCHPPLLVLITKQRSAVNTSATTVEAKWKLLNRALRVPSAISPKRFAP